jgi:hypothetical protein
VWDWSPLFFNIVKIRLFIPGGQIYLLCAVSKFIYKRQK